jgi:hypothetical protein
MYYRHSLITTFNLDTNPTKHKPHRPSFHTHIVSPHQIGEDENVSQMYLWTKCECVNDQLIVYLPIAMGQMLSIYLSKISSSDVVNNHNMNV